MKSTKLWKVLAAALCAGVLALALGGCSSSGGNGNAGVNGVQGITVTASSDAKVVPDKARISVSVVTEDKDANACQSKNADAVNAVIAALKGLGVDEKSIQTTHSDLSPRYGSRVADTDAKATGKSDDKAAGKEAAADVAYDEWVITGYEMTTSLTISDLAIDNVGAAIQACVSAGANEANGVEYYASNYDEVYNDALAKALEVARGKAEGIATASDVKLGKVVNVVEGYQDTSARYASSYDGVAMNAKGADEELSIAETMPGELEITAEVTATYAIS